MGGKKATHTGAMGAGRLLLVLLLTASFGFAQKVASVRAGLIYYGSSPILLGDTEIDLTTQSRLVQVDDGQTVGAPAGHLEILMGPAAVLWMQRGSRLRFDDTQLTVAHITLLEGSVIIEIKKAEKDRSITVAVGESEFTSTKAGLFRFDAEPAQGRVFAGEMRGSRIPRPIESGQRADATGVARFDRKLEGEFHNWAALRSLNLEKETGKFREWKVKDDEARHAGFGISYPREQNAALIKYLAASEAGVIFRANRGIGSSAATVGEGNALIVERGRREIFLGVGVVARVSEGSVVRMLRTDPSAPVIRLEKGSAVIEVGSSKEAPLLRVEVGDSVTELLERGVYEFDVEQGSLWVHAGQSRILRKKLSLTLQDGETTSLTSAEGTSKFDPGRKNSLLEWSASQSFELFAARAPFMTNWKETSVSHQATHKVFGSRNDSRVRTARSPAPSINTTITTVDGVSPH